VVRLIRSKGIGVYFVTQNPLDLPDPVLGQLGNRVHHALRAFTPKDAKNVKGAAGTLRPNPAFDTATVMTELKIGEVLISMLDEKGSPSVVERALIYPAQSRFAPLTPDERARILTSSPFRTAYSPMVDRESAYELLKKRADAVIPATQKSAAPKPSVETGRPASRASRKSAADVLGSAASSAARSAGTQLGRALIRGVLGSLTGNGDRALLQKRELRSRFYP
jgi:hypothetical protein